MAILSYSFYEKENGYAGTAVSDDLFPKYLVKAKTYLDRRSFGRIKSETIDGKEVFGMIVRGNFVPFNDTEMSMIRYGLCALVDAYFHLDTATEKSMAGSSGQNVKSMSSGGESVTYEVAKTIYDSAILDKNVREALLLSTLMEWVVLEDFRYNPFYAGSR